MPNILKSLTLASMPARSSDPAMNRRAAMIARLDDQKKLIEDPSYVRVSHHFTGKGEERRRVEKQHRVKKWWRETPTGVFFTVYSGARPVELGQGKNAVAAASLKDLLATLDRLREAIAAGELDEAISKAAASRTVGKKKAA
jgi:hypothetical protein